MNIINDLKLLDDHTPLLSQEKKENPLQTLKELAANYKLDELREYISVMVEVCLTTESSDFSEPMQRSDLLTQGRHLLKIVEAAYQLIEEAPQEEE